MPDSNPPSDKVSLAAEIIAAYVSNNSVTPGGLPALIESVHGALTNLGAVRAVPQTEALVPALPVRKSITPEYLVCFDDGKIQVPQEAYRKPWNDTGPVQSEVGSP